MHLNKVIDRYVAYNKQIERRLEGSSGGVIGALLETLAKESYYFCGAAFDENLDVHHLLTNDPMDISRIAGYKPIESDMTGVFDKIRQILEDGQKVIFIGTPFQCASLIQSLPSRNNLICIDIISTPFIAKELFSRYLADLETMYGSQVMDIRFYNKEFVYENSKRISFKNGRTVFTYKEDAFDRIVKSGKYTPYDDNAVIYKNLNERVGDITIGAYKLNGDNDGMGYAYISCNTFVGKELISKAKKRLVFVAEGDEIDTNCIKYRKYSYSESINVDTLKTKSLEEISPVPLRGGRFSSLLYLVKPFYLGLKAAHFNPFTFAKFIKLNFFTKGVHTDRYKNGFVFLAPNCALKLVDGFEMDLYGPLNIGPRRIKDSRQETRLRMEKGAKIIVHQACSFGAGSNVELYRDATLEVGNLGSNAELNIICGEYIKLGDTCNIARNATIRDTSGHIIAVPGYKMSRPVEIGNHTWICTGATIMPGVKIGDGSIVGACSYVAKNVPAFTLVQGFPALEVGKPKYFRI